MAAIGRQLKQSVNVFHSLILNLRLPEKKTKMFLFICVCLKNRKYVTFFHIVILTKKVNLGPFYMSETRVIKIRNTHLSFIIVEFSFHAEKKKFIV